jgi:hypothetical protein
VWCVSVSTGEGNRSLRHAAKSSRRNNSSRMKMNVWCNFQTCSIAPACSSLFIMYGPFRKRNPSKKKKRFEFLNMSAERRKRLIDDSEDAKAFIKLGRDIVSITLPTSCYVVFPPLRRYRTCPRALQLSPHLVFILPLRGALHTPLWW